MLRRCSAHKNQFFEKTIENSRKCKSSPLWLHSAVIDKIGLQDLLIHFEQTEFSVSSERMQDFCREAKAQNPNDIEGWDGNYKLFVFYEILIMLLRCGGEGAT